MHDHATRATDRPNIDSPTFTADLAQKSEFTLGFLSVHLAWKRICETLGSVRGLVRGEVVLRLVHQTHQLLETLLRRRT